MFKINLNRYKKMSIKLERKQIIASNMYLKLANIYPLVMDNVFGRMKQELGT